ncbi:lipid-A-disaccharide synthase [Acidithiobacillus ferrooxidans]|uniref:lipid-A-disaccharide synthase n=1 Tax=Acidithiobacillus ferrooxidans TaxID=920 RepID=UPI001C075E41|nr:lipid-A-disaccharide synthase [Acidithiobacillus ferrooxidans]MBU2857244.1 lipid-A-disaccharide synthase [Acidithiobacillus ferrooxidans]MBU2860699.1 lipid-A-disaccharide synthase [Acidithiobacillus ferrooxidans]
MGKAFILAVERSGENLGLEILANAAQAGLDLQWSGVVGSRLQAAGVQNIANGEVLAMIGLVEVLRHYGRLRRLYGQIRQHLRAERPACVVLIDHPAFNLHVAKMAKQMGIRVLYVVGPQIWAWRSQRIHQIKRVVDHMLVLFPFEVPIYAQAGVPVHVLAHPLLAQTATAQYGMDARAALGLTAGGPVLALLPGSRRGELERLTLRYAETARRLRKQIPDLRILVALAREELRPLWERLWKQGAGPEDAQLAVAQTQTVLAAADVVLVASGTATLETALMRRPAVVVYILNALTFAFVRRLVKTPFVAMPNILLQEAVYPEFLQEAFEPAQVADALAALLGPAGSEQVAKLQKLRSLLEGNPPEQLQQVLREMLA